MMHTGSATDWRLSELPYELEKNLGADPVAFVDPAGFRTAMLRAERCVCRIEMPELQARGTGFLVGPDLVLTNNHVRADSPIGRHPFDSNPLAVRARFGFAEHSRVSTRAYELHPSGWLVADSLEGALDYCLFRLAEPAGRHPIADTPDAPARGWLTLSAAGLVDPQSLFILQHPLGEPLKVAPGHLTQAAGDWIDYHVNTDHGSSGSPVFDCRWQCVALHSRAGKKTNRGVQLRAILGSLDEGLRQQLLSAPPPPTAAETALLERVASVSPAGLPVDLSRFNLPVIQQIASTLLRVAQLTGPGSRVPGFEVHLGGGNRLTCVPDAEAAANFIQRQSLHGAVEVLSARVEALQCHEANLAAAPYVGTIPMLIRRSRADVDTSRQEICDRLDVMVQRFSFTRNG